MRLIKSDRFLAELSDIVNFISLDSPSRALNFYDDLIEKIEAIPLNPYIHRKRQKLNDKNIRELIFKGYVVPFYIDKSSDMILVLGIFSQNEWDIQ